MLSVEPMARLVTLTETLIIQDITKTEHNNCFIIHYYTSTDDYSHKTTFGSQKKQ